ncbi:type II toxin-antitoxin system RelE/ParE family toxin [Sphingobium sp. EM0848]|uniref:type II toxin-antitoxin system RelE/ParE family toxin n=1 Tax=Sphingobium sp. EM0848 TaxID=2743473 RepID=UPI00159CA3A1|nr:type II toxin-antitoxin system RelE/ParE family toxin [Sphingobium sp. EM0848]
MASYRLSASAQADIIDILEWTQARFGDAARERYEVLLATAIRGIAAEPDRPGAVDRPELGKDARTWHLRLSRERARTDVGTVRRPRHFILFRATNPDVLEIGRVLYDAMELERYRLREEDWN